MRKQQKLLRLLAAIALALVAGLVPLRLQTAHALDKEIIKRILPAVVQLGPLVDVTKNGQTKTVAIGIGSGTIIDPRGYILTNQHVTDLQSVADEVKDVPNVKVRTDRLVVFLTKAQDEPPVATFLAEVKAESPRNGGLDVAVIQIVEDLSGSPVDASSLDLPSVPLGDSDKLDIGDKVNIFGYPGIGGETITFTTGDVSGFLFDKGIQGRAWIKTNADISGGNSGGTAVNDQGELIGIPTQSGDVDCRPVRDTNGDGVIDSKDVCVPIGGFLNQLRPVNLAKTIIQQAIGGIVKPTTTAAPQPSRTTGPGPSATRTAVAQPTGTAIVTGTVPATAEATGTAEVTPEGTGTVEPTTQPSGNASVSRLFFSNGLISQDPPYNPISVVRTLPSGSKNLVFWYDFAGWDDGTNWLIRIYKDNEEIKDAWPESKWDATQWGKSGIWWIGYLDTVVEDGDYKFEVVYDGRTLGDASITIGGAEKSDPSFGSVSFSGGGEEGYLLPSGIDSIDATFKAANVKSGDDWSSKWYSEQEDGSWQQISEQSEQWSGDANGDGKVTLSTGSPLDQGRYRLELYLGKDMAATADVTLAGSRVSETPSPGTTPETSGAFGKITFGSGIDSNGRPVNPGDNFPSGTDTLYAFFDYQDIQPGTEWGEAWYVDGEEVLNETHQWDGDATGTNYYTSIYHNSGQLPEAEYELRLSIGGTVVQTAKATVGGGTQPTPTPEAPAKGVKVGGTITDANTGKPIEGALFVVLDPKYSWSDYQADPTDDKIYDSAKTDRNGKFTLKKLLKRGSTYSMGAAADGYQAYLVDGAEVSNDVPNSVDLQLTLQPQQ